MGIFEQSYQAGRFLVENRTNSPIDVFISKFSNANGNDDWFTLQPGASDSWERQGWEFIVFRQHGGEQRFGIYRQPDLKVTFSGFSGLPGVAVIGESAYPQAETFVLENRTQVPVDVFITKYSSSSGDDKWFTLQPGRSDTWNRKNWEGVVFRVRNDRWGVYRPPSKKLTFQNFG